MAVVVTWPPGNPLDATGRKSQPLIAKDLAETVLIDNAPDAGGTIGGGRAMWPPAGGHTIVMGSLPEVLLGPVAMPAAWCGAFPAVGRGQRFGVRVDHERGDTPDRRARQVSAAPV